MRNLEPEGRKNRGTGIIITADPSSKTMQARRLWRDLQDGRRVRHGDHLLPPTNTSEVFVEHLQVEQLLQNTY